MADPLKICFGISKRAGGGAERALTELAGQLADAGHEVFVLQRYTSDDEYPMDPKVDVRLLEEAPLRWGIVSDLLFKRFHRFMRFMREVRSIDPDVLVPFLAWGERKCFWTAKLARYPIIYAIRCDPASYPMRFLRRWRRNIRCFLSDRVYVQNEAQRGYFPSFMRRKVFVLPNITNQRFFEIDRPSDGPITDFVATGRLADQKNHRMLIRAFSKLVEGNPDRDLKLRIYGQGALRTDLEELIAEYGLESRVSLPGFSDDLAHEYSNADAFILSSDFEGQPNALMEAMAAGLPCISTDCPTGPAELIESGVNGILIPCGDEDRLAMEMEHLIDDPERARRMGENARESMHELCDREGIAATFAMHCKEVMD